MPPEAAEAADSGSMSIEQGIAAMRALPPEAAVEPEEAPAELPQEPAAEAPEGDEPGDEPNSEGEPTPGDETEPAEPAIGDEAEEPSEPVVPAIAAPHTWDEPSKAAFAKAPPEVQQAILARETERERAVGAALETAAEARKRADAQVESLSKVAADVETILPKLKAQFADEFATMDWEAEAEQDPEATTAKWIRYQAQLQRIKTLDNVKAAATEAEETAYIATQRELMATHAPLLVHPEHGARLSADLGSYLTKQGKSAEAIRLIAASDAGIALKAMLYDQAVEAASKAAKAAGDPKPPAPPKPAAAPSRPAIRPSAPAAAASPRQSTLQAAERRLDRSGSIEDGIAALRARRSLKAR